LELTSRLGVACRDLPADADDQRVVALPSKAARPGRPGSTVDR
jgi:hypothetical protein